MGDLHRIWRNKELPIFDTYKCCFVGVFLRESAQTAYLEGVRGSHIQKCGKDAKHLDRSRPNLANACIFIWELTCAKLKINPLIPERHVGLGGHQFINRGKLLNHWTDRDQIWHSNTDSSGNGHRLKQLTPRAPRGIWRGSNIKNVGKLPNSCTEWT